MKVLQIIPTFGVAGAEKVVLNYLKYNQSDTMHIKAISLYPSQNSMYDQEIAAKGLDVTYLHKGHGFDISVVKELKNAIKQYNPDVIHTHLYALKYLLLTGEMKNRKIFHTIHNQPDKDVGKLDELINRYCFRKSKVIPVTLQDELAAEVNNYYGVTNTKVIKNGIPLQEYNKKNNELYKELNIKRDTFIIGHIGRFSWQKNHDFIINIFEQIQKVNKNTCLLLIGNGGEEKRIRSLVEEKGIGERVRFLGNRSDIAELLNIMNVFFFPSRYEGLGIVLIEAQAANIPCVVSTAIPEEVLLTSKIKRLDLKDSPQKWEETLLHPETIHESQLHGRLQDYDISKILLGLEEMYKNS